MFFHLYLLHELRKFSNKLVDQNFVNICDTLVYIKGLSSRQAFFNFTT